MGQGKSANAAQNSPEHKRQGSFFEISPTNIYRFRKKNTIEKPSYPIINTDTVGLPVEEFFENYELTTEVLGKGAFAEVILAENKRSGEKVAVKVIHKQPLEPRDVEDVRREVEILKNLRHQNIIKVYDYYEDHSTIYISMEYVSGGELVHEIDEMQDFSENDARDIMLTLIHALRYCKNRGVAHRDIKPENILLRRRIFQKSQGDEKESLFKSMKVAKQKYEIALADFGFAIQVREEEVNSQAMVTSYGTPIYVAPEILKRCAYNYKCDVWSLGILCFLLLSGGHRPFGGSSKDELYEQVLAAKWDFSPAEAWKYISKHAKNFVKRLLVQDPEKRATYDELINHQWFKHNPASKTLSPRSVDMAPMQRFNKRRKMLRIIKARQAAQAFKLLMDDLEHEHGNDGHVSKYIQAMKLSDFYINAEKMNADDRDPDTTAGPRVEEVGFGEDSPETREMLVRRQMTSADFRNINDLI